VFARPAPGQGIRCWLDEHQLLPGDDLHKGIDRGIRLWDKVLLCASKSSLTSWWVDGEINRAFQKEAQIMKERSQNAERGVRNAERSGGGGRKVLALILLNPAAIVTWVVVVGPYLADATRVEGFAATLGVLVGSFSWFWFVAYLTTHGKRMMGGKAIWITRVVGMALVGYGLFSIGRAVKYWIS